MVSHGIDELLLIPKLEKQQQLGLCALSSNDTKGLLR